MRRAQAAEIDSLHLRRKQADARGREELAHSEALLKHVRWAVDTLSSNAGIEVSRPREYNSFVETADDADGEGVPAWLSSAVDKAR